MNEFKVSINRFTNKKGFNDVEMEFLDSIVAKSENIELIKSDNFKSFVEQVGSKGCTFCPSTFKDDVKSRETFEQSQLLTLYFDSYKSTDREISFEKIKARAEQYELPILFAYDSFLTGLETRKKFSVTFLNDAPITKLKEAESVQKALMMIFPEADKSCSDVLKLYSGGKEVMYYDAEMPEINVDSLFMNMSLYLKKKHGDTNYKRKIAEFSRNTGIALDDRKLLDISIVEDSAEDIIENINDKNLPNSIIDNNRFGNKLSDLKYHINFNDEDVKCSKRDRCEESLAYQKNLSHHGYLRSKDLETLSSNCNLYHEFISGNRRLSQPELLGLATNLTHAESGEKKFKTALRSNSYYNGREEKYDNWDFYFYYIKKRNPRPCNSFCPYHDTCPHGKDILSTTKLKYHQIERIANSNGLLVSLEKAEVEFNEFFFKAVMSEEKVWHVIMCQTALGKTQTIISLLRDTPLNVLIAVPTNKLKREVCERAEKMGVELLASPSLHELKDDLPDDVWDDIVSLYNEGKSPMLRIYKAINEDDVRCVKLLKKYIRELEEFKAYDGNAITTHRRLASLDLGKYDLVIIDEDIIYSTVIPNRETVSLHELKKIKKELSSKDPLAKKIKKIINEAKNSEFFTVDGIEYDKEEYGSIKTEANIPGLCSANHFCYRGAPDQEDDFTEDCVSFDIRVKFPKGTKYIMVSATVNQDICNYYFGENNVRFYACREAEIKGTLNQYGDRPMSRSFMTEKPDIISRIKKWTGVKHTISFKKFEHQYAGDLHFGNCAGCDTLKNQDIDVIGTPHQPEWIYKLFAYSLGFDVDEKLKPNTTVVHNGYRFRFTTYDDTALRTIQFYMIESELEQAVGRARLLRCDCTVNLFSNYPLRQAVLKKSKYDE